MKRYTKEEIRDILERHKGATFGFTEADKTRVLENPSLEEFRAGLIESTKQHKEVPINVLPFSLFRRFEEDGNRIIFEDEYFERRQKLLAYSLHFWLYGDEDTLVHLQNVVWAILEEYTWSLPAHLMRRGLKVVQDEDTYVVDLFAAETGHALCEMLALVGDHIHPIITERIHREVERRILKRAYEKPGEFFWHTVTNNWSAVCAGTVGMAALYEIEDLDRLSEIIYTSLMTLENFYRGFPEDGTCLEGLAYWNYGFGYFMYFADMLCRRTEGEINLFDDEHIKNVAFFYTKVFFKGSRTASFSDGGTYGQCSISALSMIKMYYPDFALPGANYIDFAYTGTHCARFALSVRDAVYALPELKFGKEDILGTYILNSAEWYLSSAESGVGVATKAGNNDEPHNHNDIGVFLVYKNGESIISDIGGGEYTRQYFTPDTRYSIFCNSSASHSVPIINGEYQVAGKDHASKNTRITEDGVVTDIAGAYGIESLRSLMRDFHFDKKTSKITLKDTYEFTSCPSSVVERFVTEGIPTILEDRVEINNGNEKMAIYFEADKWSVSSHFVDDKDHYAKDRRTYVIDFALLKPECSFVASFEIA